MMMTKTTMQKSPRNRLRNLTENVHPEYNGILLTIHLTKETVGTMTGHHNRERRNQKRKRDLEKKNTAR